MAGKWAVTSNFIGGTKQYAVYRLRDVNAVDHSGNREYATGYMESGEEAKAIADRLNTEGTVFATITKDATTLAGFLRSLSVLEAPWDDAFHKQYCAGCSAENCDVCPNEEFRSNPEWWLSLDAEGAEL